MLLLGSATRITLTFVLANVVATDSVPCQEYVGTWPFHFTLDSLGGALFTWWHITTRSPFALRSNTPASAFFVFHIIKTRPASSVIAVDPAEISIDALLNKEVGAVAKCIVGSEVRVTKGVFGVV